MEADPVEPAHIANIAKLTDRLWVGGDLDHRAPGGALSELKGWLDVGVTDILDLRAEWSDEDLVKSAAAEVRYHHLGATDRGLPQDDAWFSEGVDVARSSWDRRGTLLVHCHLGVNRAPSMAMAILATAHGWDPIDSLQHTRRCRSVAHAAYAEDALDWWLREKLEPPASKRAYRSRLANWRHAYPLDGDRIVEKMRDGRRERNTCPSAQG